MNAGACVLCRTDPVDHAPREDYLCAACGEPYAWGCKETHHHDAYCVDIADIRRLGCGCYAHKECRKSGGVCREHGEGERG